MKNYATSSIGKTYLYRTMTDISMPIHVLANLACCLWSLLALRITLKWSAEGEAEKLVCFSKSRWITPKRKMVVKYKIESNLICLLLTLTMVHVYKFSNDMLWGNLRYWMNTEWGMSLGYGYNIIRLMAIVYVGRIKLAI
jgi:uncharacterized protein with PQ loop repeat